MAAGDPRDLSGARVARGEASAAGKGRYVRGMFGRIAPRYDLLNTLLSGGLHHGWKRAAVAAVAAREDGTAVDVCCGTGDLALELAPRVGPRGLVLGVDFSSEMLRIARGRARRARTGSVVRFAEADAERLPLRDGSVDAVTVAFGIRNMGTIASALAELRRVLRPGGRLAILEFSRPRQRVLRRLYHGYLQTVVPRLGRWLTGHPDAYLYLSLSIQEWPDPARLADLVSDAGFDHVAYRVLLCGVAAIHTAARPAA